MAGPGSQLFKPSEVRPLHHALFIHIRTEEARAVGLKSRNQIRCFPTRFLLPSSYDHVSVFAVERNRQVGCAYRDAQTAEKLDVRPFCVERGRADYHAMSTDFNQFTGPPNRTHSASSSDQRSSGDAVQNGGIRTAAYGCIEVNDLKLRKTGEERQLLVRRLAL